MVGASRLPREIDQALARGATVLTGNQRAARSLRRAYDLHQHSLGLKTWQPPAIFSWDAWTASLWHRLLLHGHATQLLLNRSQELALWRSILTSDPERGSLRTPEALAELATDAWSLLCSYRALRHLRNLGDGPDTRAFQRWAVAFDRLCRDKAYLSSAQLEVTLQLAITSRALDLNASSFVLVGFDRMTPAQATLVESLRTTGSLVESLPLATPIDSRLLVTAEDDQHELRTAAHWIHNLLTKQPSARIAVIVPSLDPQRPAIERAFRQILAPQLQDIALTRESAPFEFSLGGSLESTPMVATALDLLRWVTAPLPLERISRLLVSPYFAAASSERTARAAFDAYELRSAPLLRPEITLAALLALAEASPRRDRLATFISALRDLRSLANRLPPPRDQRNERDQRSYTDWAEKMRELLAVAQWGAPNEDSHEFQTRSKWESALDELATLDFEDHRITLPTALAALERITRQSLFAPESRDAPVQIMGPFEAAGGLWDAVWFLRAGDLSWPTRPTTNPLLPRTLQRELGMPGTDAAADHAFARTVTQRIASSAPTAVFSYASNAAEGLQRPSPALATLTLEPVLADDLVASPPHQTPLALESILDDAPLPPLPDVVIKGGANILALQAACGFRAFAEHRLWSAELPSTALGLDAAERGTLVHIVLEHLWNSLHSQRALKAMSPAERDAALDASIEHGLRKAAELSATPWDRAYLDLQHERLHTLLNQWLEVESDRAPFSVKLSEEEMKDVAIGPLRLSLRVDRVDLIEAPDGTPEGEILIDYKTGLAKPSDWLTDRPDAPQLPLYAVLANSPHLAAVAFALLRPGTEMTLKGFATQSSILPSNGRMQAPSLEAQVDEWRGVLTTLATAFYSGEAHVDPKKYPATCTHCAQRILCRLDPTSLNEDPDDEETNETRDTGEYRDRATGKKEDDAHG